MNKFFAPVLSLCLMSGAGNAFASGNTLPRPSAEAFSMTDANVALASGAAAQITNPANISNTGTGDSRWEMGGLLVLAATTFNRTSAAGVAAAGNFSADSTPIVPYVAILHRWSNNTVIGFSADSPHGLGIAWPDDTWNVDLSSFSSPPADLVKKAKLNVLRFGPAAGVRIDEKWSVGGRLFAQYVSALDENDLATVEGDGVTAGLMAGLRYRAGNLILGAAYTTRTNTEVKGTQKDVHPVSASLGIDAGKVNADILLPDRLQAGFAYRLRPGLWWEVDLDWIGWSYVDELTIIQANGVISNAGKNKRHNKNTTSVRTGIKWKRSPRLTLLAGIAYEPSPVPERDVSPTTNIFRKTRLGLGLSTVLDKSMRLDLAFQYTRGHTRRVSGTDMDTFLGADTRIYEGTYKSDNYVIGITLAGIY